MSIGRPLPRGLDPLPEETLPGFLLRLAHRLDISPLRLAARTGLMAPHGYIPPLFVLNIPEATAARLAYLTRLSRREVDALCLGSLRDRYPPLDLGYSRRDATGPGKGVVHLSSSGWLFPRSTRYCPRCLEGDASPIQVQLGGAWRKSWWLPPVFACTIHHAMLEWRCPICQQPLHSSKAGRVGADAVMYPHLRQHPTLCRARQTAGTGATRMCAGPLTQAIHTPVSPELHALQDRILSNLHLHPDHRNDGGVRYDAAPQGAASYFNDLRLLTALARINWPEAMRGAPSWIDGDRLDGYHREFTRQHARSRTDAAVFAGLPADAAVCAELLAVAEHLRPTTTDDPDRVATLLSRVEQRPAWTRLLHLIAPACSTPLQQALAPRPPAHPSRQPGRSSMSRRPGRVFSFDHRHVSHVLAEHHIQPLRDIVEDSIQARIVHRFAAVQIISTTQACSLPAASRLLELPPGWGEGATKTVRRWAHRHHLSEAIRRAVNQVIDRLDADPARIDYQRRRDVLRKWSIPPTHWATMNAELTAQLTPRARGLFPCDECERRIASILVWSILTQGDPRTAPLLHATGRADRALTTQVITTRALLTTGPWVALHNILINYSRDLAFTIDHDDPAEGTSTMVLRSSTELRSPSPVA